MPAISAAAAPMAPSCSTAPMMAGNAAGASVAGASSVSSSSSTSMSSSVSSSVTSMLGSIDSGLAGNDMLKMVIAMLILQSMSKGQESGGGEDGKNLLGALAGMMGGAGAGGSSASMMMMHSSQSSSMSIEQTVSTSHAQNAYAGVNAAAQSGAGLSATA